jgi:hypothetical protein
MVIPGETNYRDPEQRELFLSGLRLAMGEMQGGTPTGPSAEQ